MQPRITKQVTGLIGLRDTPNIPDGSRWAEHQAAEVSVQQGLCWACTQVYVRKRLFLVCQLRNNHLARSDAPET